MEGPYLHCRLFMKSGTETPGYSLQQFNKYDHFGKFVSLLGHSYVH